MIDLPTEPESLALPLAPEGQSLNIAPRRHTLIRIALLAICTLVAYSPAMQGGYIFDDIKHIQNDKRLRTTEGLHKIWFNVTEDYQHQYYPLTSTGYWVQYQLWGSKTLGYHLVNVILHIANALLLWRLLWLLCGRFPGGGGGAYLAGLIFALHPVHVQSVAWMVELKNVLSGFFFLASANLFITWCFHRTTASLWRYAAALGLFLAALLSKTAASSLPLALLFILIWKRPGQLKKNLTQLIPFFVLGIGFSYLTKFLEENYSAGNTDLGLDFADRLVLLGQTVWFYSSKLVFPGDLRFIYPRWTADASDLTQWVDLIALGVVLLVLWLMRRRFTAGPLAAAAFFLVGIGPLVFVTVAYMRLSYVANHWVYWASFGFIAVMGSVIHYVPHQIFKGKPVKWVIPILFCSLLFARTWNHAHLYENRTILWRDVIEVYPDCEVAQLNLANSLRNTEPAQAIYHYYQSMLFQPDLSKDAFSLGTHYFDMGYPDLARFYATKAAALSPKNARVQFQLGRFCMTHGDVDQSIVHLKRSLARDPEMHSAIALLAHAYLIKNDLKRAEELAEKAFELKPKDSKTLSALGMVRARQGKNEDARKYLKQAIVLDPVPGDAMLNLGILLHQEGNLSAAMMYYNKVLGEQPNSAAAHAKLGFAHAQRQQWQDAFEHCSKAVELEPSRTDAARKAAEALGHLGQFDHARKMLEQILEQRPQWPQALNDLAWLRAIDGQTSALPLAKQVAAQTKSRVAIVLDTLGAAYAATGQFDKAIEQAQKAFHIAQQSGEASLASGITLRLDRYRQKQPWQNFDRSPGSPGSPGSPQPNHAAN